jgi:hypothetical protein
MDIANNDILYQQIRDSINNSNKVILEKFKETKRSKDENEFLNMVYQDYLKYYDHILNEKYKTKNALTYIYKHLENMEHSNNFTNDQLVGAKHEQNNILNKLYHVKNELEYLTNLN